MPGISPRNGTGALCYRVAGGVAAEVALVPLATMVEELRGLADQLAELARRNEALALEVGTLRERQAGHEAQLLAKDETIVAQRVALTSTEQALAVDALALDEMRRRAEAAEAELTHRREEDRARVIASPDTAPVGSAPPAEERASPGWWARLRARLGGE